MYYSSQQMVNIYNTGEYTMTERRTNWKEDLGKAARNRAAQRQELLNDLQAVREKISVERDRTRYNALKLEQREIIAKLATI